MSIQSQIDRINNAKSSLKSAISSKGVSVPASANIEDLPALVRSIPQEGGGSGGGIIDVTELPTENIDENAVYRVTETIQTEKTEAYLVSYRYVTSLGDMMADMDAPASNIHKYVVDELPTDMKSSDVESLTELNFYFLRTDGKAYMYVAGYGVITLAIMLYQDPSYDKGFTDNVYAETEEGIYTTFESFKEFVRYFVRENGEWKEITAYVKFDTPHGLINTKILSGDVTPIAYSASYLLSRDYTEINENWFLKADGSYVNRVLKYAFASSYSLEQAIFPSFITEIYGDIFMQCAKLKVVTFKGKPDYISEYAFRDVYTSQALTTINVPWSEGEVEGAPWGATNATINYNYTEG